MDSSESSCSTFGGRNVYRPDLIPGLVYANSESSLLQAAKNGELGQVERLLKCQVNPDSKDSNDRTALSLAAYGAHKSIVELLLKKGGINPDYKDKSGRTPLSWAVAVQNYSSGLYADPDNTRRNSVIKLLLNGSKVCIDSKDDTGRTPLSRAAQCGYTDAVQLLIEQGGANPDCPDKDGRTPLSWALEYVKTKIKNSYNGKISSSVAQYSLNEGRICAVAQYLLKQEKVNPNYTDANGRTLLSHGAQIGSDELLKILLSHEKVDPGLQDLESRTPLSWFVEYPWYKHPTGNSALNRLLQYDGASPVLRDKQGLTALSRAVKLGRIKVVEKLLEKDGVEPDCRDEDGRTLLSLAAQNGQTTLVKVFLALNNVNPDSKDNYGRSPLWWAAAAGHEAVVTLFLDILKTNWESTDHDGHMAFSIAAEKKHANVVDCFERRSKIVPLHILVEKGHLAAVEFLLSKKYDVDKRGIQDRTPLHIAALWGRIDIATSLLSHGADVNKTDINGMNPLRVAIQHRQKDLVRLLLEHSAAMEGIMLNDWFEVFEIKAPNTILVIPQSGGGKTTVEFWEGVQSTGLKETETINCHL